MELLKILSVISIIFVVLIPISILLGDNHIIDDELGVLMLPTLLGLGIIIISLVNLFLVEKCWSTTVSKVFLIIILIVEVLFSIGILYLVIFDPSEIIIPLMIIYLLFLVLTIFDIFLLVKFDKNTSSKLSKILFLVLFIFLLISMFLLLGLFIQPIIE